jgi:hypothetical protein
MFHTYTYINTSNIQARRLLLVKFAWIHVTYIYTRISNIQAIVRLASIHVPFIHIHSHIEHTGKALTARKTCVCFIHTYTYISNIQGIVRFASIHVPCIHIYTHIEHTGKALTAREIRGDTCFAVVNNDDETPENEGSSTRPWLPLEVCICMYIIYMHDLCMYVYVCIYAYKR